VAPAATYQQLRKNIVDPPDLGKTTILKVAYPGASS